MTALPPAFYFGAMSPYSWFTAERIGAVLPQARWRGVLAGGVFKAAGRESWGFTERRSEKMADCEARAAAHGLGAITWPEPWPTSDLAIARGMAFAERSGALREFTLAAMRLAFREGVDLGEPEAVAEAASRAGLDPVAATASLSDDAVKQALREATGAAIAAGVIGVPTVAVAGELFWGDDRLRDAAAAYGRTL
ncbi:MAG TPA: DsbA family protein [Solirubrobacteraceae bacterium]|nr:DsbA family protein [Solirubrobacteraceae bacterium]